MAVPTSPGPAGGPQQGYATTGYAQPNGVAYQGPYQGPGAQQGWEMPPRYAYRDGQALPAGYHLEERARTGLVVGGVIMVGVPYVIGLSAAASANFRNGSGFLLVPVLGPWITLGVRRNDCVDVGCVAEVMGGLLLVMDGLLQLGGGVMTLVGFTATKTWAVRDNTARLTLTPAAVGQRGQGLVLSGQF